MIILRAVCYGITMKIADLLDEHWLKLFPYASILFGIARGFFGLLLILYSSAVIGNIMLAMNIAFIIRGRLDFLNHQIATSIIIIWFLLYSAFLPQVFLLFYFIFLFFGLLRDSIWDRINKSIIEKIYENFMWYYPIPTLIYSYITYDWQVFFVFAAYSIAYDITKFIFNKKWYT